MIEDTLAKIEARLKGADSIPEEKRRELQQLLATLKSEVAKLSKTHAEQAQSIAGFTEISAHEATRDPRNPQLLDLSLKGGRPAPEHLTPPSACLAALVPGPPVQTLNLQHARVDAQKCCLAVHWHQQQMCLAAGGMMSADDRMNQSIYGRGATASGDDTY